MAWNDDYIFYFVEVNDTTPNHEANDGWARDSVEFFIDWHSNAGFDNFNDGYAYWQIRIASAPNADGVQSMNGINGQWDVREYIEGIPFVVVPLSGNDLSNGYIIEIAFPTRLVDGGINLAEGMVIPVDFQIGDNQDGTGRASQAFLTDNDRDTQWNNPSGLHGRLTLLAAPAPPVVDEPEPEPEPEVVDEPPAAADPAPPAPAATGPAPVTADPITLIAIGSILSAAGVVVAKKRRK